MSGLPVFDVHAPEKTPPAPTGWGSTPPGPPPTPRARRGSTRQALVLAAAAALYAGQLAVVITWAVG